jgi:uncharacterized membrane protein
VNGAPAADDQGTVLLLILGLVVLAAMLVAVVTDVSALYLQRRELMAAADGAALAGAQAVDKARIYRTGLPSAGPVPLDPVAAKSAALSYLASVDVRLDDVRVETTGTTVSVTIATRYPLPVSNTVTLGSAGSPVVDATATARTAVVP